MARIALTMHVADSIIRDSKRISETVRWSHTDEHSYWAKCEVMVENNQRLNLKMYINLNLEEQSLFSFSLILNNAFRIRGLDFNGSHGNKHTNSEKWQGETHKHIWTDQCRDSHAYTPTDITTDAIKDVFLQFCEECNIVFSGDFQPPPCRQTTLEELL